MITILCMNTSVFSDRLETHFVCVDATRYPKSYSFFKQLIEKHINRVEYVLCVQNAFDDQTLKHYGKILCVPLNYLIKLEVGDGLMEGYIETYVCAEMSKYQLDKVVGTLTYHALGLAGIYLIVTRYLQFAIPIVALGGVGYLANLRK